jgi:hypothetical protein
VSEEKRTRKSRNKMSLEISTVITVTDGKWLYKMEKGMTRSEGVAEPTA